MLNYGIKFHDIKENVVSRVGNFKNTDRKKEMLFWSEEEFKQFYAVIDDDLFRVYFSFLYLTGCRKGESLALTWNDIDFVRREVRINKSLNRKQKTKGEKQVVNVPTVASDLGWHISESRSYEITTPKNKSSYRNILMPMNLVGVKDGFSMKYWLQLWSAALRTRDASFLKRGRTERGNFPSVMFRISASYLTAISNGNFKKTPCSSSFRCSHITAAKRRYVFRRRSLNSSVSAGGQRAGGVSRCLKIIFSAS